MRVIVFFPFLYDYVDETCFLCDNTQYNEIYVGKMTFTADAKIRSEKTFNTAHCYQPIEVGENSTVHVLIS
jgi:hypothetical protein